MAQRTSIRLFDDLDNIEIVDDGGETVNFAIHGRRYEIDLTRDHANEMRSALDRYVRAARKVGGPTEPSPRHRHRGAGGRCRGIQPPGRPRAGQGQWDRCLAAGSLSARHGRPVPRRRQLIRSEVGGSGHTATARSFTLPRSPYRGRARCVRQGRAVAPRSRTIVASAVGGVSLPLCDRGRGA